MFKGYNLELEEGRTVVGVNNGQAARKVAFCEKGYVAKRN